jgi:hypothetical protein
MGWTADLARLRSCPITVAIVAVGLATVDGREQKP